MTLALSLADVNILKPPFTLPPICASDSFKIIGDKAI